MDLFTLSASLGLDIANFEGGINMARRLLLQFAGAVVDFGKDVVETGMGFDKQMSAVQAVMGLTENTAENLATMNELREFALEQARDSIFTSEETAKAYYYMGMAGWSAEQAISGLPGVMALAAASGEDLKMTSDMVTDSLTAFGLGAGQAAHFADVLAVTATNANTDVARMQQTFKNLAPIAGALGYSIEDVALSVGLIANSGVKGSQAGTALRNIFTRIATNAGATAKDLGALQIVTDELGVSFYTAEGRARPWGEVLADMREAWNKLDPDKADKVTAAFGEFSASSRSADEIMAEFASDLDAWTTEWNSLTTAVEREQFVAKLEPQFAALGISMRDSNGQLREFSAVAKDARTKLGGLTDQEQIYYGKQIGSLRGIAGWLALMTASEADVRQLTDAIRNADGAAQAMADTRLDNLWGDIARFNAELDVLKIALYDDVKSPLRDVVQYATGALENITDAVSVNGLLGGIQQLGVEIRNFTDKYEDEIEALGEAITPILTILVDTVTPAFLGAARDLGSSFVVGVIEGAIDYLDEHSVGPLGAAIRSYRWLTGNEKPSNINTDSSVEVKIKARIDPDTLVSDLDDVLATAAVGSKVKIGGLELDSMAVADLMRDLESKYPDFRQSGITLGEALGYGIDDGATPRINDTVDAVSTASISVAQGIFDNLDQASQAAGELLATDISNAGVDGGSSMASSVLDAMGSEGSNITNSLYNSLSNAGSDAGTEVANSIQRKLSVKDFFINVVGYIGDLFGGKINRNASAMSGGRIYRTSGIFGYANGAFQIAGDAGPEAVVGVNSLQRMITNAVHSANAGSEVFVPREAQSRPVTVIMQVGEKEFGRLAFELGSAEEQRVGVRLAKGGAY